MIASILSKYYLNKHLPKIVVSLDESDEYQITREKFLQYWIHNLSLSHRKQALCFFMEELIELVNKTNNRLLCRDLVKNLEKPIKLEEEADQDDRYQLLNMFEMLWNIDSQNNGENISFNEKTTKAKGHALMIKEEYLKDDSRMISICEKLREPGDFLNAINPPFNK